MDFTPDEIACAACYHWHNNIKDFMSIYELEDREESIEDGLIAYGKGLAIHEQLLKLLPIEKINLLYIETATVYTKNIFVKDFDYLVEFLTEQEYEDWFNSR